MKIIFLLFCIFGALTAMASYVNSCFLKGTIANEPKKDAKGVWTFEFTVISSEKYGRADSGCHDQGKTIPVSMTLEDSSRSLKKGESLKINKFQKKNSPKQNVETYSLIQEE